MNRFPWIAGWIVLVSLTAASTVLAKDRPVAPLDSTGVRGAMGDFLDFDDITVCHTEGVMEVPKTTAKWYVIGKHVGRKEVLAIHPESSVRLPAVVIRKRILCSGADRYALVLVLHNAPWLGGRAGAPNSHTKCRITVARPEGPETELEALDVLDGFWKTVRVPLGTPAAGPLDVRVRFRAGYTNDEALEWAAIDRMFIITAEQ